MECTDGVLELYQGDDWAILFTLRNKNTKVPVNLTGATEITFAFVKTDGTLLTKTLSGYVAGNGIQVTSAIGGSGSIEVPNTETGTVKSGQLLTHKMVVTIGGKKKTYKFEKNMTVFAA